MVRSLWDNLSGFEKDDDYDLILTLPKGTQGFVVFYDESKVGLGCVLM